MKRNTILQVLGIIFIYELFTPIFDNLVSFLQSMVLVAFSTVNLLITLCYVQVVRFVSRFPGIQIPGMQDSPYQGPDLGFLDDEE